MTEETNALYARTMAMLGPALERVASDAAFRDRLEVAPLAALAEMGVEVDETTRRELEGKRFSEFWAARRQAVEGTLGVRDLPPEPGALSDAQLDKVAGGFTLESASPLPRPSAGPLGPGAPMSPMNPRFAPPYVPVAGG
jgi:hypothetical protein